MKSRLVRLVLLFAGLAVAGPGRGQDIRRAEPASRSSALPSTPEATGATTIERSSLSAIPVDPSRRLAVGDVISFQIQEDREPPVAIRVSATGEIAIPQFDRFRASGKTTVQLENEIKAFLEKDYYYNATVIIALEAVNPVAALSKISVSGEVRAPGTFEFAGGQAITLTEAIMKAGNFTQWAKKDKVHLYRGGTEVGIYDVRKILSEGRVQDDPILRNGDRIHVDKSWFNIKGD